MRLAWRGSECWMGIDPAAELSQYGRQRERTNPVRAFHNSLKYADRFLPSRCLPQHRLSPWRREGRRATADFRNSALASIRAWGWLRDRGPAWRMQKPQDRRGPFARRRAPPLLPDAQPAPLAWQRAPLRQASGYSWEHWQSAQLHEQQLARLVLSAANAFRSSPQTIPRMHSCGSSGRRRADSLPASRRGKDLQCVMCSQLHYSFSTAAIRLRSRTDELFRAAPRCDELHTRPGSESRQVDHGEKRGATRDWSP